MATKSEESKSRTQVTNSASKRRATGVKPVTAGMREKRATLASTKGRAVHGRTKSQADAKAGKPGDGKKIARFRTGPNGGEDQTTNGVRAGSRGADGPPGKTSRKNTRGEWPGGEKPDAQLHRRKIREVYSPQARAARGR